MTPVPLKPAALPPVDVSRETRDRLDIYAALLRRWNPRINLVADLAALEARHIADCLQLAGLVPDEASPAVDLGSGAGLPGLVLAIATGRRFVLIESDRRKAAFLAEAARATAAPVTVCAERIEHAALPPAFLVTARALAPLPKLLALAAPLLAPGGACLFLKGAAAPAELAAACAAWQFGCEAFASRTAPGATVLRITGLHPAG